MRNSGNNKTNPFTQKKDELYRQMLKLRREWEELMRDENYHMIF